MCVSLPSFRSSGGTTSRSNTGGAHRAEVMKKFMAKCAKKTAVDASC